MLEVVMPGVAHAAAAAAAAGGGGGGGRAHPVDGFPLPPPHGGWGGHSALPSSLQMAPPDTPQQQLQQPQTHVKHAELVPPGALPPGTAGAAAAAAAAGGADVLRAASLLPGGAWPPPQGLPGPHPPRPPPPISPLQAHYAAPGVRRVMDMRAGDGMPGSGPASGATGGGVMGPGSGGATPRGGLTSEREAGSSVAADLMQQTLAGEIDGLIRRFQVGGRRVLPPCACMCVCVCVLKNETKASVCVCVCVCVCCGNPRVCVWHYSVAAAVWTFRSCRLC